MKIQIIGQGSPVIAITTGVHGNEKAPVHSLSYISFPKTGTYITIVANEEALALNKRFCCDDLNRVFPGDLQKTDEHKLAAILTQILCVADYVIDVHTTTSQTPAFVIYTKAKELAKFVPLHRAVCMGSLVANGKSLIDNVAQGVSLEFASTTHPTKIASVVSDTLRAIIDGKKNLQQQHFEVYGVLNHDICGASDLELSNFKMASIGGEKFISVLAGETSYKNTACLMARIIEK